MFGYHQNLLLASMKSVKFAATVADGPYNVVAMAQQPLLCFCCTREFYICIKITKKFGTSHTEGTKAIGLARMTYDEGGTQTGSIDVQFVATLRYLP